VLPASQALRLLFVLKLRAALRMQVRKLRKPLNWLFLALGLLLLVGWAGAALAGRHAVSRADVAPAVLQLGVEIGLFSLLALTVIGAFQHRGLYLPKDEIERFFSAPLARADLVRYRLLTVLSRSLLAAAFFGLIAARRLPGPAWAFAGMLTALLTMPLVGQLVAVLLGDAENRLARLSRRLPLRLASVLIGVLLGGALAWVLIAGGAEQPEVLGEREGWLAQLSAHPLVRIATLPVTPWARMITASSAVEFLPWLALAAGAWLVLYGALTRISIDFRELSLETSADVARRIRQARRMGWSGGAAGSARAGRVRGVPWLFGVGRFGAVAWLETASLIRRARGTILLSAAVVALLTLLSATLTQVSPGEGEQAEQRALVLSVALISCLGTIYLCAGLRFDFRARLDHMEQVKSWPLAPWRLFLATIAPEVLLVSLILCVAVVARAAWIGILHPGLVAVVAFQPLVVLTWVALDNAVFLRAPVRYVPGQESALQHIGRSILLLFLRMLLLGVVALCALLPAAAVGLGLRLGLELPLPVAVSAAGAVAWAGLFAVDAGLVWLGGRMLVRLEPGSER
jgi:hypothetical protein